MRFRRKTFRRRRNLYQMQPLHLCPFNLLLPTRNPPPSCAIPIQFASELINLSGALPVPAPTLAKGIIVRGINFQYSYSTLGEAELGGYGFMEARSAIVRLPKDPFFGVPSFLPNLFQNSEAVVTERVLWRGSDILWTWDSTNGMPQAAAPGGDSRLGFGGFCSSLVPGNASAQANIRVKTACRVKENESIYFVTNIVHSFSSTQFNIDLTLFGSAAVRQVLT